MQIKFKDIKEGQTIKFWVDSDFFGNPIYQTIKAESDAIDLSENNPHIQSGYGIYYDEKGLMYLSQGDSLVELVEE